MSKRSAKFVAALFVSVLAGANLATLTDLRAQAATADDCLTAPKGATSPGSHWYYRIDRATKRQCWYLREESDKASDKSTRATPPVSPPRLRRQPQSLRAAAAYDHAQSDFRRARGMGLPAIPRRTGSPCQSRATNNRRRALHANGSGWQAQIGTNVLAPAPVATSRWLDNIKVNAASNPANVRPLPRSPSRPPTNSKTPSPYSNQPCSNILQQPAPGIGFAAADSSTTKPTASLQMLLR